MNEQEYRVLHKNSIANKGFLKGECSCFYCERSFNYSTITNWHLETRGQFKGEETAFCPHCKIDSVIPKISEDKLKELNHKAFGISYPSKQEVIK